MESPRTPLHVVAQELARRAHRRRRPRRRRRHGRIGGKVEQRPDGRNPATPSAMA
jgi:hypothetical protein